MSLPGPTTKNGFTFLFCPGSTLLRSSYGEKSSPLREMMVKVLSVTVGMILGH